MEGKHGKHMLEGAIQKVKTSTVSQEILGKLEVIADGKEEKRLLETKNLLSFLQAKQSAWKLDEDQILSTFREIPIKDVLSVVEHTLTYTHQESKWEMGNILLGKVTALICIIRSQRLDQTCGKEAKKILSCLTSVQRKKTYLQLPCISGVQLLISMVDQETFTTELLPQLTDELSPGWEDCTPERLLLGLICYRRELLDKDFLKSSWGGRPLLDRHNWNAILDIMITSTTCSPVIHPVHEVICDELAKNDQSMLGFWSRVRDKLFQPGQKKLIQLGLFYLKSVVPCITTTTQLTEVLSPVACLCIHRNLSTAETSFKELAKAVGDRIATLASNSQDGHLQAAIIRHLLCNAARFGDTVYCRKAILKLNPEGVAEFTSDLIKIIKGEKLGPGTEGGTLTEYVMRKWAAHQLKLLMTKPAKIDGEETLLSILQFFCLHGFFGINKPDKNFTHVTGPLSKPIPENLRPFIQDCFFASIKNLYLPAKGRDSSFTLQVLYRLTSYAQSLLSTDAVSSVKDIPEQVEEELQKTLDVVRKIQSKKTADTPEHQAFQMLFLHLGIQLLVEPKVATDILKDLHVCYEKSRKKAKKAEKEEEEEPAWIEVITELLISMMSQQSSLTRRMARSVFRLLSQHVTRSALDIIVNVLHQEDDEGEDGPITFEDKDDESDTDDDESEEKMSPLPVNGHHGDKNGHPGDSDDDDSSEEEEVEVDDRLRQTVKAALGPAAADSEDESNDDMGDEEMFKFDDALAEAFRSMQQGKPKAVKNRRQQLITFKLRTLDLVETFVKCTPSVGLAVCLVNPILDLIESGFRHKDELHLGKRASVVLHQLIKPKKVHGDTTLDREDTLVKMGELIQYSTTVSSLHMVKNVSLAFLFMMRVMLNQEAEHSPSPVKTRARRTADEVEKTKQPEADGKDIYLEKVLDLLKTKLSECLNKKTCRLHHMFFHTILERYWIITWPLSGVLLTCIKDESIRVFLRTQACSMLTILMKGNMQDRLGEDVWKPFALDFTTSVSKIVLGLRKGELKPQHTQNLLEMVYRFVLADPQQGKILVDCVQQHLESLKSSLNGPCAKIFSRMLPAAAHGGLPKGVLKRKSKDWKRQRRAAAKLRDKAKEQGLAVHVDGDNEQLPAPSEQFAVPSKQKRRKKSEKQNDENSDMLSDSTVASTLSEASVEETPKRKAKKRRSDGSDTKDALSEENLVPTKQLSDGSDTKDASSEEKLASKKRRSVRGDTKDISSEDSLALTTTTKRTLRLRTPRKSVSS